METDDIKENSFKVVSGVKNLLICASSKSQSVEWINAINKVIAEYEHDSDDEGGEQDTFDTDELVVVKTAVLMKKSRNRNSLNFATNWQGKFALILLMFASLFLL